MSKTNNSPRYDWVVFTLAATLALTLAIGIGFLAGQKAPLSRDNISANCQFMDQELAPPECIALRSTVAAEAATSISRWGLWVSFGSLVASSGALIGLIIAFRQGNRTIMLATEANRIAIESGQTQARAYVVVQSVECRLDERGQLTTRVKFQNSGLSPARRLRWQYSANLHIVIDKDNQRRLMLGEEPDLDKTHWQQDIPSAETWTSGPTGLLRPENPEVRALLHQAEFIAATIKIVTDYQDVFGTTHREVACFQGRADPARNDAPYSELDRGPDDVFDEQVKQMTA